jgi:hypothetical protein
MATVTRNLIGAAMVGLGLLFVFVAMKMNYRAGLSLGEKPEEGLAFAWLAVAVVGANAGLPFAISWGFRHRQWGVAAVAMPLLALFLAYSLGSALGYAWGSRGVVVSSREDLTKKLQEAQQRDVDYQKRLKPQADARPVDVLEAVIARQKQDRLWTSTRECTDATALASRDFCKEFEALRAELASAKEAKQLRADIERASGEVARLRSQGAGRESDPQAGFLSRLFGFSVDRVRSGWSVLQALLVELGSAFLPYIGLTMLGVRHARSPAESNAPMRIEAHLLAPERSVRKARRTGRPKAGPQPPRELPPLRSLEFDKYGRLKISDQ